jgi:prepilin-type N-terminal cleavage/methylation domain-containing protein
MYQKIIRPNRGFTLIEILVVIAILGIILPILFLFFTGTLETMNEVTAKADHVGSLRLLMDRLRREISCAFIPSDPAFTVCFVGRQHGSEKEPRDELNFLSFAHQWRGGEYESYDMAVIGYRIMEKEIRENDQTTVIKILVRREDAFPDPDIERGGDEIEMVDFIYAMRITYFDGSQWVNEWNNTIKGSLPQQVRVDLYPADWTGLKKYYSVAIPLYLGQQKRQAGFQILPNTGEQVE